MLLDVVYVRVVILLNLVFQEEGGLQVLVPQDDEVELELEAAVIAVLQVDGPLIVLALVVLFDASAYDASLRLVSGSPSRWHIQASSREERTMVFNGSVFKIFLISGLCSSQ